MRKRLRKPRPGEVVDTHYGLAEVIALSYWSEVKDKFNSEEERRDFICRVEFFLGSVERYFEFVVKYLNSGEIGIHDWSEYQDNFSCRERRSVCAGTQKESFSEGEDNQG